jgi:predicted dehydrogenase
MSNIRWGILGCGRIARKFAADIRWVKNASLQAVASRDLLQAQQFAAGFGCAEAHGSYLELAHNPNVDVIYIATPHSFHFEQARLCLQAGKAVLCEKSFTINRTQAAELVELALDKNVFLMEALWTRFLPQYTTLKRMIAEGKVGNIQYVYAEFGFRPTPPVAPRLYDLALGGGALLDIGVYPVFLALDVLGRPEKIHATMIKTETGADVQSAVQFFYPSGAVANLFSSFKTHLASGADIGGDAGRIRLTHRFHGPLARLEFYPDMVDSLQPVETENIRGFGYEYEIQHVCDCLTNGLTESPLRTHADTLLMMETLDRIRAAGGLTYPADR